MNLSEPGPSASSWRTQRAHTFRQNHCALVDSLTGWFGALAKGTATRSGKIPWMIWDESAGEFIEALKHNIRR
jgi:hypothetical protein